MFPLVRYIVTCHLWTSFRSAPLLTGEFPNERQKQLDPGAPFKNLIDYSKKDGTGVFPPPVLLSLSSFIPSSSTSVSIRPSRLHLILLSPFLIAPILLFHLRGVTPTVTSSSAASSFTSSFTSQPPHALTSFKAFDFLIRNSNNNYKTYLSIGSLLLIFFLSVQPTTATKTATFLF